ncbi:MAG: putative sulfate exporter family transporter [Gammaproteobacteria bacterium]|nr:putative sulfate exporter family transporter [Gammaproteobacteria bacterium]
MVLLANPAVALLVGGGIALALNCRPFALASTMSKYCLQTAIVLLGLQLDLGTVWKLSASYSWLVAVYVLATLAIGLLAGRLLATEGPTTKLIASGTAICGGTAIATLGATVRAQPHQIALALAIVFLMNAVAVFAFPPLAHWLNLTQLQLGIWAALAIHDTSSVLAAASMYGDEALQVATTIKLGRTLWLIPLILGFAFWEASRGSAERPRMNKGRRRFPMPGFVLPFIAATTAGSLLSFPVSVDATAKILTKSLLVVALFFVGTELTREVLQQMRGRVVWLATGLWALVVPMTLLAVLWAT